MFKTGLLSLILAISIVSPSLAYDAERVNSLKSEVANRDLQQHLDIFENYLNALSSPGDTIAANSVVNAMNALSGKYPTVNSLHKLTSGLADSGYYSESAPMLLYNLNFALEKVREYGFGSGKFSNWQFMHVKGMCGRKESVYYATIKHPAKNIQLGFFLSAGPGVATAAEIKKKKLDLDCI